MRLDLFFTYFGGKWRIAKHYPAPSYDTIIEPFAGSAGYSLHYPDLKVLLFDLDPKICGVWDYLIHASEADIMALPDAVEDVRSLPICQEAKWVIGFWLNKGMTSPCNIPGKWMRDGWRPNSFWGKVIKERIASGVHRIRHWKVQNIGYADIPNQPAHWFVDPPYARSGVRYRCHDVDYEYLGRWCREREGDVVVCEQDGADWLPFVPFRNVKALEGKKGSKQSKEVVWTTCKMRSV